MGPPPRPSPAPPPDPLPPPPPGGPLGELIGLEERSEALYHAMAQRSSGRAATTLNSLSASSARLLRRLRTEAGLRGGDVRPPSEPVRIRSLNAAFRTVWELAERGEQAYQEASRRTSDPELARFYENAAETKRRQRRLLRELAGRVYT